MIQKGMEVSRLSGAESIEGQRGKQIRLEPRKYSASNANIGTKTTKYTYNKRLDLVHYKSM